MPNVTVTNATVNHDSVAALGLANNNDYTLNNSNLIINGDVRWGQNEAVLSQITISSTQGGSVLLDGRDVWEIPFSASSGVVPTLSDLGTNTVTQGATEGELFRVWATGSLTPSAAGGAMPATGWIKLRIKAGDFIAGTINLPGGATITATGPGRRSWIHVVGQEGHAVNTPRLGTFSIEGDWYDLGTTTSDDDQTFQFPVADACPAIQIETGEGTDVYEWYLNAGVRWGTATQFVETDVRGKYFGMDNATGVITIAQRAINACGFKPPTGCRVRIPNVICSSTTSANYTANTINNSMGSRYDFITTAAGVVSINKATMNWYLSCTSAFNVTTVDSSFLESILLSNIAGTPTMTRCAIGINGALNLTAGNFSNLFSGITLTDCRFARNQVGNNNYAASFVDVADPVLLRVQMETFAGAVTTTRSNSNAGGAQFLRCFNVDMEDCISIGGRLHFNSSSKIRVKNLQHADLLRGPTSTTSGTYIVSMEATTTDVVVDGISSFAGLEDVHPYAGILFTATGVNGVELRNIGTADAPYSGGSANQPQYLARCSVSLNLVFRRCYLINIRTRLFDLINTNQNVVIDNCWGDDGDEQRIASLNTLARGCRWTNSVTGQAACYGRHWEDAFVSETAGRLLIPCNEPLPATADQVSASFALGSGFTSTGGVSMATAGDFVIWTMPYLMLGVTGFAGTNATITGTNSGNHSFDFQWDNGSGWNGDWFALTGANLSAIGAINPATGVRLQVRATVTVSNNANALLYIRINTVTNATARKIQYPLPRTEFTVVGFEPSSDVVIYNASAPSTGDGSNVLATGDEVSNSFVFDYEGTPSIRVGVFKPGFVPQISPTINLTTNNSTYTIQQRVDRNYN